MTNEVTNETENSSQNENPVVEETNAADSTEAQGASAVVSTEDDQSTEDSQNSREMDFGAILQQFEQEQTIYHAGDLVPGKVVGISDRGVLVDFGYKSEGIVPIEEFTSLEGEMSVKQGDEVEIVIRSIHSGDAPPILSYQDAASRKSWAEIEKAFNEETPVVGRVIDKTKGGLRVDLNGVEAFLPGSQVDSRPNRSLDPFVGHDIEAKIIKFSRKRNNIVLSRKVLTDEVVNKQKSETLGNIEEGYVIEGTIKNLTEYGAFLDIGGIDGLLHVTDMSWGRLMNPNEMFKVNDQLQVKVLKLDREREKVALGYKQLMPDPWSTVTEIYPVGAKIKGKVSSVTDYGAFIELEAGVEGLVHVSEMSWSKRSKSPRKMLNPGEEVEVQVLGVDTNDRRISLGMKQLQENPWDTVLNRYHVGSTVKGRVRNLTDFGAFVEVEEGVDGLVHVSDISHSRKIKHPKDVLRKDQEIEAVITSIDPRGRRMSLSIKDTAPSEWESFVTSHKPGDIVRGKISRFAGFGVFVQLGEELEGLCHISELSDERVERPEDVAAVGQEMDFKILRIEHEDQKIGLSARAVGKEEEKGVDSKLYSTEVKGGMSSLGELMNLRRGGAVEEEPRNEQPKPNKKERKAQRALERSAQADEEDESSMDDSFDDESANNTGDDFRETESTQDSDVPVEADNSSSESGSAFETGVDSSALESTERADQTTEIEVSQPEQPAENSTGEAQTSETDDNIEEKSANS
ncbi:MAG TPA: S1 RNA-binding domain-containing protein [Pyrinomonadaceae bacterium]|nr:S1 RNA-binding domain-containing protein [Pyrinomonadaceae bacterium]